jgi:hypothetical protein
MVRGWVYVISNQALPGLVKVGFSTKDPQLRARDLANTGVPHSYRVEYDALVPSPRDIEQRVHGALAGKRADKEWFQCTPQEAVDTIRRITDGVRINETVHRTLTPSAGAESNVANRGDANFFVRAATDRRTCLATGGSWLLSERSLLLTHRATGRTLTPRDYSYEGSGSIKGFALRDRETPWVRLEDVEFTE